MTPAAKPASAGTWVLGKTGGAAWAALIFVLLFHPQSGMAKAGDEAGLSLEIRCRTNVFKAGDEIPIKFIISNHRSEYYGYWRSRNSGRMDEFELAAKTASGGSVPDPFAQFAARRQYPGGDAQGVLGHGESFTKTIVLNRSALIKAPGRYEVTGSYHTDTDFPRFRTNRGTLVAAPISIMVLPRTQEEMDGYIKGLTNQIAAALAGKPPADQGLEELMEKLMYTCSPEIVPTVLRTMNEAGSKVDLDDFGVREALLCYVPHTEETVNAVIAEAFKPDMNWKRYYLLKDYDISHDQMKQIIGRTLESDNNWEWVLGATLAANVCYDDSFTARLTAIALHSNASHEPWNDSRGAALNALACNRTDAGLKTLKTLLNNPDRNLSSALAEALLHGFNSQPKTPSARPVRPEDFDAREVKPLIERMLASPNRPWEVSTGQSLAALFGDDAAPPKPASPAK